MPLAEQLPNVVYIAGYGRSGSTVLDLLLGDCENVVAVGELFMFFSDDPAQRCACGATVRECEFWRAIRDDYLKIVADAASVGADAGSIRHEVKLATRFRRRIEGLVAPCFYSFRQKQRRTEYGQHQRALCAAIGRQSGASILVDSSKTAVEVAWRPWALWRFAGIRPKVIHLVRDGRAVMWSVLRGCNRKMERGEADPSLRWPRLRSVLGWTQANVSALLQSWLLPRGSVLQVSYEDLSRNPAGELARIGRFLGIDLSAVSARLASGKSIPARHTISGNRLRTTGIVEVREDDEWRQRLPASSKLLYWTLGWPAHLAFVRRSREEPGTLPEQVLLKKGTENGRA